MNFNDFRLESRISAGAEACGYETPTPIQEKAIPPVMEGHDVMGLAQTGTGKTAAFGLPILHRLLDGPKGTLRALILAPTRELAEQIKTSIRALGAKTQLNTICIYGGVGMEPQVQALRRGADIVVACPGRLLDHIKQKTIDLRKIGILVLDEADMMLDMGFMPDIRRIMNHLPAERQNLMFSATMPEPIRKLSHDILRKPVTIQISNTAPVETVSHALYPVSQHLKTSLLLELLSKTDTESVLIFTRTKHRAKRLGLKLTQEGYNASSLQGNLSQSQRQAALTGFRTGKYNILVATDIAARGIDVSQVSHVINYDIPGTPEAYTHRIGRTGRALRTGDAFTLVANEDAGMVREIEKVLGAPIERRTVENFDYKQAAPKRDTEFARAPMQRPVRSSAKPRAAKPSGAHPKGAKRQDERKPVLAHSPRHEAGSERPDRSRRRRKRTGRGDANVEAIAPTARVEAPHRNASAEPRQADQAAGKRRNRGSRRRGGAVQASNPVAHKGSEARSAQRERPRHQSAAHTKQSDASGPTLHKVGDAYRDAGDFSKRHQSKGRDSRQPNARPPKQQGSDAQPNHFQIRRRPLASINQKAAPVATPQYVQFTRHEDIPNEFD